MSEVFDRLKTGPSFGSHTCRFRRRNSTIPGSCAMNKKTRADSDRGRVKRRDFVKSGGAALAGGVVLGLAPIPKEGGPLGVLRRTVALPGPTKPRRPNSKLPDPRAHQLSGIRRQHGRELHQRGQCGPLCLRQRDQLHRYGGGLCKRSLRTCHTRRASAYRPGKDLHRNQVRHQARGRQGNGAQEGPPEPGAAEHRIH